MEAVIKRGLIAFMICLMTGLCACSYEQHITESDIRTENNSEKIKLKVYLVKNKHENQVLKQGETNFRDSFSIQSTVYVVFYKGLINWSTYIPEENAPMKLAEVKKDMSDEIVYTRVFDVTYRDDAKSAGEVAGNGKW